MTIQLQAVQQWCKARAAAVNRGKDRGEMIVDNFVLPVVLVALRIVVLANRAAAVRSLPGAAYRARCRRWAAHRRPRGDRGTAAIELVIVTPVVIVLLLTVVALGRYSYGKLDIEQASAAAARAASLTSSPAQATAAAQQAAHDSLDGAGVSCTSLAVSIDTTSFRPGGIVSVTLSCTADLSSLAMAGVPGSVTVARTSSAPLETYRQFGSMG